MEGIFQETVGFQKDMARLDPTIRAGNIAVMQNFEDEWHRVNDQREIRKVFDFKHLRGDSGGCYTYQIRGVQQKYRLTLCSVVTRGQSTIYWTMTWHKRSKNDRNETETAKRICKHICKEEAST